LGALALLLLCRPRPPVDAAARLYMRFRHRLAQHGIDASPSEGPRDLLARIERAQLPAAAAARRVIELYIDLRYTPRPDTRSLKTLRRAVRDFR
ncbi:MAG TPA: DUF4129 domain-containing protein, partial [Gammaproteobacteria bacterium]